MAFEESLLKVDDALLPDIIHEVSPLVYNKVLSSLKSIEKKIPRSRCKFVRICVPGIVELQSDVCVNTHGEIVIKHSEAVRDLIRGLGVFLHPLPHPHTQLPPVELLNVGDLDIMEDLLDGLVLVPPAPVEWPGEVVARAQGDYGHWGRMRGPGHGVNLGEHPAHCPVTATHCNMEKYKLFDLSLKWCVRIVGDKKTMFLSFILIVLKVMKRELDPVLWCAKRRYTSFIPSRDISIWPHYTPHNHGVHWEFPVSVWRLSELRNASLQAISQLTPNTSPHQAVCVCNIYCGDSNPRQTGGDFVYPPSPQVTKQSKQSKSKVLKVSQNITTFMGQFTRKKAQ